MYHPTVRELAGVLKRLVESEEYMSRSQGVAPDQKIETGSAAQFLAVSRGGKKFLVTIAEVKQVPK